MSIGCGSLYQELVITCQLHHFHKISVSWTLIDPILDTKASKEAQVKRRLFNELIQSVNGKNEIAFVSKTINEFYGINAKDEAIAIF